MSLWPELAGKVGKSVTSLGKIDILCNNAGVVSARASWTCGRGMDAALDVTLKRRLSVVAASDSAP